MGLVCSRLSWLVAIRGEAANQRGNLAEARARRLTPLGAMLLIVLSRDRGDDFTGPGVSAEDAERFNAAQEEMQAELAALSTKGKHVIAEESGHYIQVQRPELVIDEIRAVIEAARAQS